MLFAMERVAHEVLEPFTRAFFDWYSQWPMIGILAVLMSADILSGMVAAFGLKKINSTVSMIGMSRKALMLILVGVGTVIDPYCQGIPMAKGIATFFCISEAISVSENCSMAGVPLPTFWVEALDKLRSIKFIERRKPPNNTVVNVQQVMPEGQVNIKVDEKKSHLTKDGFKTDGP